MPPLPHKPKFKSVGSDRPTTGPERHALQRSAVQEERLRVAQLLHNTVCQELTGICFLASAAAHRQDHAASDTRQKFEEIADLIQRTGVRLAEIVHTLNKPPEV